MPWSQNIKACVCDYVWYFFGQLGLLSQHLIPHTSASSLSICFEAELICMQQTWSSNATGKAQAGLDLTVPQRQWQVNRHFTRVYTVIYSSLPSVKEVAKSAFNLALGRCPLLFSALSSNTVKLRQVKKERWPVQGWPGIAEKSLHSEIFTKGKIRISFTEIRIYSMRSSLIQ